MMSLPITPLEAWIVAGTGVVDAAALEAEQMRRLRRTVAYAQSNSAFYHRHLAAADPEALRKPGDLAALPFTDANMLRADPLPWLCVGQKEIGRIVTLESSGTEGGPKRIFFTGADQELTTDFFAHGMRTLTDPPGPVLILMPGARPGSIGDLLAKGLDRQGIGSVAFGPVADLAAAYQALLASRARCIVGIPNQVLALARYGRERGNREKAHIDTVLLSADYVPQSLRRVVESLWQCRVFSHYGMTEMGLGGGVECAARDGYHLREMDLLLEIVDPASGQRLPDGEEGEVVFTTLTRQGMPFIRYRTGDSSRFLTPPCPCGSFLRRLAPVSGRLRGIVTLEEGKTLRQPRLDEALFPIEEILDFRAAIEEKALLLDVGGLRPPDEGAVRAAVAPLLPGNGWRLELSFTPLTGFENRGTWKRTIDDRRKPPEKERKREP